MGTNLASLEVHIEEEAFTSLIRIVEHRELVALPIFLPKTSFGLGKHTKGFYRLMATKNENKDGTLFTAGFTCRKFVFH